MDVNILFMCMPVIVIICFLICIVLFTVWCSAILIEEIIRIWRKLHGR